MTRAEKKEERSNRRRFAVFSLDRIVSRVAIIFSSLITVTVALFVLITIPSQRDAILDAMASEARSTVTSIDQVTASAIIMEDFGAVVEHCLRVVKDSPSVLYVVVTRNDGFSVVMTTTGWEQKKLHGLWCPAGPKKASFSLVSNELLPGEVFHYSHPFTYSGIDWGWIHIGLSLGKFHHDLHAMYLRTILLALLCIACGIVVAVVFARRLTKPISTLDATTQEVAAGSLTARADIRTGDELERLGHSFNKMTENLRKSREDIVAAREYTDNIIRSMNDALLVTNPQGIIERVNTAAVSLLGHEEGDLLGKPLDSVIALGKGENNSGEAWGIAEIVSRGFVTGVETWFKAGDGARIPILFSASVMKAMDGTVQGVVCAGLDITVRKRSEEALVEAKEAAEASNRAKSQFLANMSHEIRTPMNGVLGMIELMLNSGMNESQQRLARMAQSSAEKLLEVINEILDFSRIESGKLVLRQVRFCLRETLEEMVEIFRIKARQKGLVVGGFIDTSIPPHVEGDEVRLRQILINLLNNAIKFTEAGEVRVVATVAEKNGGDLLLSFDVSDTGCGIEPEAEKSIYEAFVQADGSMSRRHEGAGLGLAISKQLVEMMGGSIELQSRVGVGSTFRFTVRMREAAPAADVPAVPEPVEPTAVSGTEERLPRVLLVEDNEVNQEVGKLILEALGCEVDVADDGRAAIDAVLAVNYDLVFMDCQMPNVDGYEATRTIRGHEEASDEERHLTIVALTAHVMDGDREKCLAQGMDDYLPKPFTAEDINAMLKKWLVV